MFEPKLIIYWPAIIGAMVAAFVFGFIWYGPLFGKVWAKAMGFEPSFKPTPKAMQKAMILQITGLFLTSYVLAHSSQIWRASVWGVGDDGPDYMYGFYSSFFTWLGFYLPMQFGKVAWEGRSWRLLAINSGHDFLNLLIMSQILCHMR